MERAAETPSPSDSSATRAGTHFRNAIHLGSSSRIPAVHLARVIHARQGCGNACPIYHLHQANGLSVSMRLACIATLLTQNTYVLWTMATSPSAIRSCFRSRRLGIVVVCSRWGGRFRGPVDASGLLESQRLTPVFIWASHLSGSRVPPSSQ